MKLVTALDLDEDDLRRVARGTGTNLHGILGSSCRSFCSLVEFDFFEGVGKSC